MSRRAKILYLSHDGLTDPLGQSQILPYLVGLSRLGFSCTIVSFEKKSTFAHEQVHVRQQCELSEIRWVPLPYRNTPPLISTWLDIRKLRRTCERLHREADFDIVHCRSYITPLAAMRLRKRIPLIFDMRGFWADERVDGGLWNLKNPLYRYIYRYFKKKEQEFLTMADHVVVLTENAKQEIESWQLQTGPISVIPTCGDAGKFDPSRFTNAAKSRKRKELGLAENEFVLLYLGSTGTWYQVDRVFGFFERLRKQTPTARLLFVTPDRNLVPATGDNVIVTSVASREVPELVAIANASVFFIRPAYSKKASSATRMAELMLMGIPVVTNTGWGDIDSLTGKMNGLFAVESEDNFDAAIEFIEKHHDTAAIRNDALRRFGLVTGVEKYRAIYESLL